MDARATARSVGVRCHCVCRQASAQKYSAQTSTHRTDCTTYRCEKNPNTREQNRNLSGRSSESWSLDLFPGFAISSRFSRGCCEDSTRPDLAAHLFIVQGGLLLYDSYTVSDVANVMFVRACFVVAVGLLAFVRDDVRFRAHLRPSVWPILRLSSTLDSLSSTSLPPLPSLLPPLSTPSFFPPKR